MIARVVVENAAYSFDIPFSYQVPQQMQPDIRPGCRVLVPFGKANRAKQGLVLALEESGEQENLKPLKTLLDYQPLLDSEQLWLLELLHRRTFCTYYEALRALVPSGLTVKVRVMCSLGETAELQQQQPLQELQQKVLDYLREKNKSDYKDYLCMCELLEHDMKSSFVLFPNDLKAEHDRVNDMSRNDVSQAYDRRIAKMFEGLHPLQPLNRMCQLQI